MSFINAFVGLCSAVGTGTATEFSGVPRQPLAFSSPVSGISRSTRGFTFGALALPAPVAGRALFDAPSGGNLLLVLPRPSTRPVPGSSVDAANAGEVYLSFTAMASYPDGDSFTGSFTAGSIIGVTYDALDILGPGAQVQGGGYIPAQINSTQLSAGTQLVVNRGTLMAHGVFVS